MSLPVNACAKDMVAVTPDDNGSLNDSVMGLPVAFVVETSGDIKVRTAQGRDLVIPAAIVAAGDRFPLSISRVFETDTTAEGIYVLYGVG